MSRNITWHLHSVTRRERESLNGHRGCVVWFTGLSGAGKSTVANLVDRKLYERDIHGYVLDGDNVRHGLDAGPEGLAKSHGEKFAKRFGLGFSAEEREENIRRIGEAAKLFCENGIVALVGFISPYRRDRDRVRANFADGDFIEVFVDTPLEICEHRDPKGLYKRARAGEVTGFTGIDDPYEAPLHPEIRLDGQKDPRLLADEVVSYLEQVGVISSPLGCRSSRRGGC